METSGQVRLAQQVLANSSYYYLGSLDSLALMGVLCMTVFLLVLTAIVAFIMGRAAEGAKRDAGKPTAFTLDQAQKQGYLRARMSIDPNKTLTLDETLLVLHRLEGLVGAVNDNFYDLHKTVKKYGAETDETTA